ncbi:MAG: SDR family NAD(P)-dependent oxidoreductase, partial [Syntrophales bacterium]|nr:SDR family NAD(P)-dependent oxidoreductase [Syntrophales bacterium]
MENDQTYVTENNNVVEGTIWITGASSGFGAACARRFAAGRWRLILSARRQDRLAALAKELGNATEIHQLPLDVRKRKDVSEALAALPLSFRNVDVLVNNAGLALGLVPAPEADLDDWETMVDTNVKGLMYMTRLVLPLMVARGRG